MNCASEFSSTPSADLILCTALDIGEQILRSGGEIHRVEDTVARICRHCGAAHVEVFTIPSLIVASARMQSGEFSHQMRRVYETHNDLYRIEEMNRISRSICDGTLTLDQAQQHIHRVKTCTRYPRWLSFIGAMCACGGFTVFFGGTLADAVCSALIGLLISFLKRLIDSRTNQMVSTVLASLIGSLCSIVLVRLGFGQNVDKIIIGTIMLLVPGLAISNAIRNMFMGDILSGAVQFIQSVLLALTIAGGVALAFVLTGGIL